MTDPPDPSGDRGASITLVDAATNYRPVAATVRRNAWSGAQLDQTMGPPHHHPQLPPLPSVITIPSAPEAPELPTMITLPPHL